MRLSSNSNSITDDIPNKVRNLRLKVASHHWLIRFNDHKQNNGGMIVKAFEMECITLVNFYVTTIAERFLVTFKRCNMPFEMS